MVLGEYEIAYYLIGRFPDLLSVSICTKDKHYPRERPQESDGRYTREKNERIPGRKRPTMKLVRYAFFGSGC
jgi:hypothetical protein